MYHKPLNAIRRKLAEAPDEWLMPQGAAPVAAAWSMVSTRLLGGFPGCRGATS